MVLMGQQATVLCAIRGECEGPPRGLRPRRASHRDYVVTREIRQSAQKKAHPRTSVRSEEEGRGCRKSEAPIRATRSGNADGAKGCRFGRTGQGDMDRHSAGEAMTTRLARLTQKVQELRGERLTSLMGMLFDPKKNYIANGSGIILLDNLFLIW